MVICYLLAIPDIAWFNGGCEPESAGAEPQIFLGVVSVTVVMDIIQERLGEQELDVCMLVPLIIIIDSLLQAGEHDVCIAKPLRGRQGQSVAECSQLPREIVRCTGTPPYSVGDTIQGVGEKSDVSCGCPPPYGAPERRQVVRMYLFQSIDQKSR